MKIPTNEIEFRKAVGKVKRKVLWHVKVRGGLHIYALDGGEIIGAGSHRGVARHMAQQHCPDLEYTELSKSEYYSYEDFAFLIPEATEITNRLRKAQGH